MKTIMKTIALIVILYSVLFFVAGCSKAAGAKTIKTTKADSGRYREINVTASNWKFEPSTIEVQKGENIQLKVKNREGVHGLAISGLGVKTNSLDPGEEDVVYFTANQSGTFTFYCNVYCGSGHKEMKGTMEVK